MNSFPDTLQMRFSRLVRRGMRHYAPWCRKWLVDERGWYLAWTHDELRRYYLYHLFLHEIGHLHQPEGCTRRLGEDFAENFALEWARRLGELVQSYDEAWEQLLAEWDLPGVPEEAEGAAVDPD